MAAYQHPLITQAFCECGSLRQVAGTRWAAEPECERCGRPMMWLRDVQLDRFNRDTAARLNFLHAPLSQLGLPQDGLLLIARPAGRGLRRFLVLPDSVDAPSTPRGPAGTSDEVERAAAIAGGPPVIP